MNTSLKIKIAFLCTVLVLAVITVVPSFYKDTPEWWQKYVAPKGLRLGLDLQGGMHLILKVNLQKAEENSLAFAASDLKDSLAEQGITVVQTPSSRPGTVVFTLPNSNGIDQVKKLVSADFSDMDITIEAQEGSFPRIFLSLKKSAKNYISKNAVDQSLEILRNRIDQFGVTEPVIVKQGTDEIVIQLPGIKDPKRAIKLLGDTAQLEFKLVADFPPASLANLIDQARQSGQWQDDQPTAVLNRAIDSLLPDNTTLYFEKEVDKQTRQERLIPLLLENKILMTGEMVKDAQVRVGGTFNEPYVSLDLTSRGGKLFGQITEKNVGRRMAIVLDGVVRSAPVIRERILGGSAQISGSFSHEEATDLAIVLRVGALPAPVDIVQNMTVGASLGMDSINKGLFSGLLGAGLVIVFMLLYYRLSGFVANTALFLNILLLFSGLAVFGATLTLPGIAGIILTIGMAVDANVLIFERMREEYSIGKSVRASIDGGFDNAFWSIVDSQVTSLITALALFLFGTGPVKGFAVTLTLGIIFNLFAALFYSRLVYDGINAIRPMKKLRFFELIKKPNLDYLKIRKITYTISAIFMIIGVVAMVQIGRGKANMGVDFSGGSLLQYRANSDFAIAEVRPLFAGTSLEGVDLQRVENEHRLMIKIKKSMTVIGDLEQQVSSVLQSGLPEKGFTLESQSEIGSTVSSVLKKQALMAVAISMLGVVIYLAFRFDIRFGVAAAIATFHDVILILGLCWMLNLEVTLLLVTALLTLAGYSLNDTVVVFDRIRENIGKLRDSGPDYLYRAINDSVNQVLSRTLVTSLTTIMVLAMLLFFGGSVLYEFTLTLLVGVLVGTYSSIFIASPILTFWDKKETGRTGAMNSKALRHG